LNDYSFFSAPQLKRDPLGSADHSFTWKKSLEEKADVQTIGSPTRHQSD